MRKGGHGGGKTITGLRFEKKLDLKTLFQKIPGYSVQKVKNKAGIDVLYEGKLVARFFIKNDFYYFLNENNIDWKVIVSKKLIPDNALLVIIRNTLFIFEIKYQEVAGSVDEKLQTCDFKRKQFSKLVKPLNLKVEYVYILSEWFKKPKYKDVLDYIESMNCHYIFGEVPLSWLGLPFKE
ncbi:MAG: hypothetical protein ACPL25_00790 [Ignavibacteria bacterium]